MLRRLSIPLICVLGASLGCVSKNYVRQQVTPLINKVNELDDLTAQNTRSIKETDQRVQTAIQQAGASGDAANQKALASDQQAEQAQARADTAVQRVANIEKVVAGTDDYKVVKEITVSFAPDSAELSDDSKAQLGQLVGDATGVNDAVVVVEGFTDSMGSTDYNYLLSDRRADVVRQYLAGQCSVPAYKIHTVGLGEDTPIAANNTSEGRAQNRRAKVQLLSNRTTSETTTAQNR